MSIPKPGFTVSRLLQACRIRREANGPQLASYFAATSQLPKLLVTGMHDRISPPVAIEGLAKELGTKAQLVTLPDCGHLSHEEASTALLDELHRFVGSLL